MAEKDNTGSGEMSAFAAWFLRASDRVGQSQTRIAERAGLSRSYIFKVMNSHKPEYRYYQRPSYDKTLALGVAVGDVTGAMQASGHIKEYQERTGESRSQDNSPTAEKMLGVIKNLLGGIDDPLSRIGPDVDTRQFSSLPLATGAVSAGHELPTFPGVESEQFGDVVRGDVRTIRVDGNCMEPFYRHGDILFVQRSESAGSGDKIVAVLDGETVACKVYRQADEGEFLEATNGKYPKITGDFRIVGIVKGSYRP